MGDARECFTKCEGAVCFSGDCGEIVGMWEFVGRWIAVGLAVWGFFRIGFWLGPGAGGREHPESVLWLVSLAVGFGNALMRPVFLEFFSARVPAGRLVAALFGALAVFNGVLFGFWGAWAPGLGTLSGIERAAAAVWITAVAGAVSSIFYAQDGRWRRITYHGSRHERVTPRKSPGGGSFRPG